MTSIIGGPSPKTWIIRANHGLSLTRSKTLSKPKRQSEAEESSYEEEVILTSRNETRREFFGMEAHYHMRPTGQVDSISVSVSECIVMN